MSDCILCPRACHADRLNGSVGYCGQTADIMAARASLHYWEEPCISGTSGSGTVFFSGCNLRCVFCQNHNIALGKAGRVITPEHLVKIFLQLQEQGANNINLVTPTHFLPQIVIALQQAKNQGLLPEFKDEEDQEFARRLFCRAILNCDYYRHLIGENTRNWDLDRVAFKIGRAHV